MSESVVTKNVIADGFKTLMLKKPFEKITISDITDQCGLNRQTFYYHFQDKYELLNWVFYTEIITPFAEDITIDNWSDKLLQILITLKDNSRFYSNAFRTSHGEEFRQFLFNAVTEVLCDIIDLLTEGQDVNPDDKQFIAEFFSYGIAGSVSRWVITGMKRTPEATTAYLKNLVNDFKAFAVSRYVSQEITPQTLPLSDT